jgi:hypothetical protein
VKLTGKLLKNRYKQVQTAVRSLTSEDAGHEEGEWHADFIAVEDSHTLHEALRNLLAWLDINCPDGAP